MAVEFDPTGDLSPRVILVEASAGTGKTYSITNCFLRLVVQPELTREGDRAAAPEEILVVTFTEAATAEMRERIRSRLRAARAAFQDVLEGKGLTVDPFLASMCKQLGADALHGALSRVQLALASFDRITISTIHGFCRRVLARHGIESGVEPECELAADLFDLVDDAVTDYYVIRTHGERPEIAAVVAEHFGLESARYLCRIMVSNPDLASRIYPREWTSSAPETYERWLDAAREFRQAWVAHGEEAYAILLNACAQNLLNPKTYRANWLQSRRATIERWLDKNPHLVFPLLDSDVLKYLADYGSDKLRAASKAPVFLPPRLVAAVDAVLAMQEPVAGAVHGLLMDFRMGLLQHVLRAVEEGKRRANVQGFDDLLRRVRDALRKGTLYQALKAQYRVAIIDEFQDTDPVQWEIFARLFLESGKLFLVGDPKQSIYAFRGADLESYLAARKHATTFTLSKNYRSDGRLIHALNCLYAFSKRQEGPFLRPEVTYQTISCPQEHEEDRWQYPAVWPRSPLRIALLAQESPLNPNPARKWAANFTTSDIARFLDGGAMVPDGALGMRPVRPKDIAVLVRTHFEGSLVQDALRESGIPSVRRSQEGVFSTEDATQLKAFLDAVISPDDEHAVATALTTELFGLSVNEVSNLGASGLAQVRLQLGAWAGLWERHGLIRMLCAAFQELRVAQRLLPLPDGERRLANLYHLAELLYEESRRRQLNPFALLEYFDRRRAEGRVSDADLLRLESDRDAVQIVTIHGAKGLEYPFVWVPFLFDQAHKKSKEFPIFHDSDGQLNINVAKELKDLYEQHSSRTRAEEATEAQRLAYVALTRAKFATTVVVCMVKGLDTSPVGRLLGIEGKCGGKGLSAADIEQVLERLAASSEAGGGRTIHCFRVSAPEGLPKYGDQGPRTLPPPALWPGRYPADPAWGRSSFTSLGGHDVDVDLDQFFPAEGDIVPLDAFPRGPQAGLALHKLFEHLARVYGFAALTPALLREEVARVLAGYGSDFVDPVADMVQQVIATPLDNGPRLCELTRSDCLPELGFVVPVRGGFCPAGEPISPWLLASAFSGGDDLPPNYVSSLKQLDFPAFRGFLSGVMDLVFRWRGKYYLVDYKSNFLTSSPDAEHSRYGDYAPKALLEVMAREHYVLQYHLYVLALHRFLAQRLGAGYDYDRDFGGVFYLFLRGVRPDGQTGVFYTRPPFERIRTLSALFGEPRGNWSYGPRPWEGPAHGCH